MTDEPTTPASILIVEDDIELAAMMEDFLSDEGFETSKVHDGESAIAHIASKSPDLVLLDYMLPKANGIDVAKTVRPNFNGIILMLTAKDDDMTEVNALNRGADGFLQKPVRPHILLAHIRASLRRSHAPTTTVEQRLHVHELAIDLGRHEAHLGDKLLDLTTDELALLVHFVRNAGATLSREALYTSMKGVEYDGLDRAMDMRISTLRKKLGDQNPPYQYIKTIRGKGYMLAR